MPQSPETKGFGQGDPALSEWAESVFHPEDAVLREIRERSIREGLPAIAVGRFDGLHLEVIARAIGALKAVEIGTLGGYSGVCLLRGMGVQTVPKNDRVVIRMPGGGGLGNPRRRPAEIVADDVRLGFISAEAARRDYGVALNDDYSVNEPETARLRQMAAE